MSVIAESNMEIKKPAFKRINKMDLKLWKWVAITCGLIALLLIYIPIVWLGVMSISESPLSGRPYPLTIEHYKLLFENQTWLAPFGHSVALALVVSFASMILGTFVARSIITGSRSRLKLVGFIFPLFIPGLTMGAALFIMLRTIIGFKLGYWSLFIGHIIWTFPFALILILIVMLRLDRSLMLAAQDLGAKPFRSFWDVEFPLLLPGILGAGIFSFLLSFNELMRSIFLHGTEKTMPIFNWMMTSAHQSQVPIIFALSTLMLLVTLPTLIAVFLWTFGSGNS